MSVTIEAPVVCATTDLCSGLADFVGSFDGDFSKLRQVMSPIVSTPTQAQVNDALRELADIRQRVAAVAAVVDATEVRADRSQFKDRADRIISALEGRGLDRARDLLTSGDFTAFFSLTKGDASRANRFMSAMSNVVNSDLPLSTIEADISDDVVRVGENPDDDFLDGREDNEEGLLVEEYV